MESGIYICLKLLKIHRSLTDSIDATALRIVDPRPQELLLGNQTTRQPASVHRFPSNWVNVILLKSSILSSWKLWIIHSKSSLRSRTITIIPNSKREGTCSLLAPSHRCSSTNIHTHAATRWNDTVLLLSGMPCWRLPSSCTRSIILRAIVSTVLAPFAGSIQKHTYILIRSIHYRQDGSTATWSAKTCFAWILWKTWCSRSSLDRVIYATVISRISVYSIMMM